MTKIKQKQKHNPNSPADFEAVHRAVLENHWTRRSHHFKSMKGLLERPKRSQGIKLKQTIGPPFGI